MSSRDVLLRKKSLCTGRIGVRIVKMKKKRLAIHSVLCRMLNVTILNCRADQQEDNQSLVLAFHVLTLYDILFHL